MFAIVRTGGKQYKVQPQKVIMIEKLDLLQGDIVTFDKVLMVADGKNQSIGFPYVKEAFVKGVVLEQMRDDKIIVFKKKRRHNYRRKQGHRQYQTVIRITEISGPNGMHFKAEGPTKALSGKKEASQKKTEKAAKVAPSATKTSSGSKKTTSSKK